jgi:YebC/PmpR family DNA-binding regulatory protein
MAGHSKWKTIKRAKAATDAKRGAVFTKLIREITVAAKAGGGDPDHNPRLRLAIDTARSNSMPKENIERAVKKGTGELEGVDYQEVVYEAYGPGGVALMVMALTDNPTRTVADVRHKLSRNGGNMGTSGSVAFLFDRKGQMALDASALDEDAAMEAALEAGAEDFQARGGPVRGHHRAGRPARRAGGAPGRGMETSEARSPGCPRPRCGWRAPTRSS